MTRDHGAQVIRWAGQRAFDAAQLHRAPRLRPVRILQGALGDGLPERDLLVSRQHRMLLRSGIARRMFNASEVLVPAIKLTSLPGIFIDEEADSVTYYHLLFDRHEILFAEGAPTESLLTGPQALKSLPPQARREILSIFPELADLDAPPKGARLIPNGRQQNRLIARHLKNRRPCIEPLPPP